MGCSSTKIKEDSNSKKIKSYIKLDPKSQYEFDIKHFPDMDENTSILIKILNKQMVKQQELE